jgi:Uma2 family endonuclease
MGVEIEPELMLPDVELDESDGEPLESHWHVLQIGLLLDALAWWFRGRDDYYAGGNMFIYYSEEQARTRRYRGPDFFYVRGVKRLPIRRYWVVWLEDGRYPDLIIELLSPKTAKEDRTTKKELYERTFKTHEYFCYDPLDERLEGWRLRDRLSYQPIDLDERGWMWVEGLGLWLGPWQGTYQGYEAVWLRFYDPSGQLVPLHGEAAAQRADTAEQRAETAEAELAQLKARLAELEAKQKEGEQ